MRRSQLDEELRVAKKAIPPRPSRGWIAEVRTVLQMTGTQLARRLGVAQSVASNSEKSERNGSISLKTLSRAAGALGCELRYVLVLRDESLRKTLEKRATAIALSERNSIAQHMRLENQSPDTEIDLAFEAAWLIAHNDRRLWD